MILRLLLLMLSVVSLAPAWTFTYSDTTATEPFWFRPAEDLSSVPIIGLSRYSAQSFVAPTTATYYLSSVATNPLAWDNFIVLYQASFNAGTPLSNAIAANDNFGGAGQSRITASLTAGTTYHLVTTGYWLFASGDFSNSISNTPEPATWLLLAFGCAMLLLRRQLLPSAAVAARAVGSGPRSPRGRRSPGHPSLRA